jgi:eukaryotic-like serine/threonine-protein kinase
MRQLPSLGSVIGGRYRIDDLLGQGGMGAVFAAVNLATGGAVAIKWLLPEAALSAEALERFVAEAHATSKIEHPNVISVLDAGQDGGSPFLVMERLRGESLQARIRRGPLTVVETLDVAIAACRGIAEAHNEGVLHRDLKPDNIFLCQGKDGSPRPAKVLDFGVSKLYESLDRPITETGIAMGTPQFMAPEQVDARRDLDGRVDVYAMGVVLYFTLSGRLPYDADGLYVLVQQIMEGRAAPLRSVAPEVPADLEAVVMRAMCVDRNQRQPHMRALIAELETIRARYGPSPSYTPAPLHSPSPVYPPHTPNAPYAPTPAAAAWSPGSPYAAPSVTPPAMHAPPFYSAPMHSGYVAPPKQKRSAGLYAAVAVAFALAIGGFAAIAIGAVYLATRSEEGGRIVRNIGGGGDTASDETDDPLRPRIDLTISGECHPRFDRRVSVITTEMHLISIGCAENDVMIGGLTIVPANARMEGTIELTRENYMNSAMTVTLSDSRERRWGNYVWNWDVRPDPDDPVRGSVTFHRWDPDHGIVDVTFSRVTLRSAENGTLCHVDGRVRTFGLTWGGAEPH